MYFETNLHIQPTKPNSLASGDDTTKSISAEKKTFQLGFPSFPYKFCTH